MKKMIKLFLITAFLFLISNFVFAGHEQLFIHGGIIGDDSFSFDPYYSTFGSGVELPINSLFSFTPEANIITYKMNFDTFWLEGAALINANFGNLFIGGGITKWFLISDKSYSGNTEFALKLNAGVMGESLRVRFFLITPFDNLFKKGMIVGATLGLSF